MKDIPKERVTQRTGEPVVDEPDPPIRKEIWEVILPVPQEQVSDREGEQIVDALGPQTRQKIGEVIQPTPQETSDSNGEKIETMAMTSEDRYREDASSCMPKMRLPHHVRRGRRVR